MKMEKLIIVTGALDTGGVETVTARIANYYIAKGYDVGVVCLLGKEDEVFVPIDKKAKLFFFKEKHGKDRSKLFLATEWVPYLKGIFKAEKPDFVLAMTLKIGALCSLARKGMNIRLSFREINDPKSVARNRAFDRMLMLLCRRIDGVIFQTEWERSCYPRRIQRKGRVIPNPVSVDIFWKGNPSSKRIVTMGRLDNAQKRHDVLLKAFALFLKKNPGYSLTIYGTGPDKKKEEKLIEELNLEDSVLLAGAQRNVHELITDATMFVMTSEYEGLSNALAEAMLMGMPCISSDWPGCSEIIEHGKNGFLYKRQNIEELAEMMNRLANDEKLRDEFSANAKKLKDHFDPDVVLHQYAELIEGE